MEQKKSSLKSDMIYLLLKIAILVFLLSAMLFWVFGLHRCGDDTMSPAIKNGDLVLYYRMQKDYVARDVVVVEVDKEIQVRRIVAIENDVVDFTPEGMTINGYYQQEAAIYKETLPFEEGITFPITVGQGEYFVLADDRTNAKDSRIYGVINQSQLKGLVASLIRRRGL